MSTLACGEPLALAHLPVDAVIRIDGLTDEQLAVGLDPLPDGAPVVIRQRPTGTPTQPRAFVDDVLGRLESIARDLFPAWLPGAEVVDSRSDFDRRVVRRLAHRHAAESEHFGPFLAELAEAALCGRDAGRDLGAAVRARGLARILAASYGRAGVVLLVGPTDGSSETEQLSVAVGCEWLVNHGGFGVWLTRGALPSVDRFPTWRLPIPAYLDALSRQPPHDLPSTATDFPPLAGQPHPASVAERTLERLLARCDWAAGRTWNQEYASHSLAPPIRVDLMWPHERCVVEIDGPDHRGVLKYAADRRRDNGLVLDGFAVLRFTNDEIDDDPPRVLAIIEGLLANRRHDEGKTA